MRHSIALLVLCLCGCGSSRSDLTITFLADHDFRPLNAEIPRVTNAVMELSALAYDPATGEVLAIPDDGQPPRLYRFRLRMAAGSVRIDEPREVPLPLVEGQTLDTEALALTPVGLFIANEGRDKTIVETKQKFYPRAALLKLAADGKSFQSVPLQPRYTPAVTRANDGASGPLDNGSFEALTCSPGGRFLFVGMQLPLIEDGPPATPGHGATVRILRLRRAGEAYAMDGEFAYPLDPTPPAVGPPTGPQGKDKNNGLVELVALSETRLLAMEKGGVTGADPSAASIRIYDVDLAAAPDISNVASLAALSPRELKRLTARKRLVVDLAELKDRFSTPQMDNFEGLTLGPTVNGLPTLLLITDDNGQDKRHLQRTTILALTLHGLRRR